ncbi:MAG: tRNA (adenosine(37)-N6)-threonylcarbamoyltransferase complex dimerization subunit type 1 TsaB [Luteimonas sp.]
MKLLAFETATEACSVAVWIDGDVRERFEIAPRRHAELALPWAEQLLADAGIAKAQLDAIAVGRGPGAFTGVRLAIALAQGIALALDRPVLPVSTLAALAMRADAVSANAASPLSDDPRPLPSAGGGWGEGAVASRILAAIDARMGEVYSAAFLRDGDGIRALSAETVGAPDAVALPDDHDGHDGHGWIGIGSGFAAADAALQRQHRGRLRIVDATALPHAADVARLGAGAFARGEALPADRLEPAYLRNHVALTLIEQQAARAAR